MKILFAVKKGDPDWKEVLITEHEERIPVAKKWAVYNGFDRLRVADIKEGEKPDFTKVVNLGGANRGK